MNIEGSHAEINCLSRRERHFKVDDLLLLFWCGWRCGLCVAEGGTQRLMGEIGDEIGGIRGERDRLRVGLWRRFASIPHHGAEKPEVGGRQRASIRGERVHLAAPVGILDAHDLKLGFCRDCKSLYGTIHECAGGYRRCGGLLLSRSRCRDRNWSHHWFERSDPAVRTLKPVAQPAPPKRTRHRQADDNWRSSDRWSRGFERRAGQIQLPVALKVFSTPVALGKGNRFGRMASDSAATTEVRPSRSTPDNQRRNFTTAPPCIGYWKPQQI